MANNDWLGWAKRLNSIAQAGFTYSKDPFDIERFEQIREISAEMIHASNGQPVSEIVEVLSAETGYPCPKVGVRAAVIDIIDGKPHLLLTQELAENGAWTMPGGFADIGDTPSEAAERETFEETGYRVKATKVVAAVHRNSLPNVPPEWGDLWYVVFLCELIGGEAVSSIETGESRFFPLDALPPHSHRRSHPQLIEWVKAHVVDEGRLADFN